MEEKRLSRREREKERQRGEMLTAALELFSKRGYHGVSMHEIAKKAEFAVGTVYKFFKGKEHLYETLMNEIAVKYHAALKDALSKDEDTIALLGEYVRAKAEIFADNASVLRLYIAGARGANFNIRAGLDKEMGRLYDDVLEVLALVIEKGVRKKVLKALDPHYMAVALDGLTNAFLFCWLKDPERHPYQANLAMITELFLRGSLAR
jgi:AcrR family transcriptional regulator